MCCPANDLYRVGSRHRADWHFEGLGGQVAMQVSDASSNGFCGVIPENADVFAALVSISAHRQWNAGRTAQWRERHCWGVVCELVEASCLASLPNAYNVQSSGA